MFNSASAVFVLAAATALAIDVPIAAPAAESCLQHRLVLQSFNADERASGEKVEFGELIEFSSHAVALGRFEIAYEQLTRAIELDPARSSAYLLRAQISGVRRDFRHAFGDLDAARRLNPVSQDHLLLRAELEYQRGHFSDTIEHFDKVLGQHSTNVRARLGRANALRDSGDIEAALNDYSKLISHNADQAIALFHRAIAYHRLDAFALEENDWSRAISLRPSLYWQFGLVYRHRHLFNELQSDHAVALSKRPRTARDYLNRADAWRARDNVCAAIEDYSRAIDLRIGLAPAHLGRGISLIAEKQYRLAVDDLNTALKRRRDVETLYYRSIALRELGLKKEAFASIDEAYTRSAWNPVVATEWQEQLSIRR